MNKISKKTKKILSIFLALMLLIGGTSFITVFADQLDTTPNILATMGDLGGSDAEIIYEEVAEDDILDNDLENLVELGMSDIDKDERIQFEASPLEGMDKIYQDLEFSLDILAPTGEILIPLGASAEYSETRTKDFYEKLLKKYEDNPEMVQLWGLNFDEIEDLENLIKYDSKTREIKLQFEDINPEERNRVRIFVLPKEEGTVRFTATHEEGYSNYTDITVEPSIKTFISPSADFASFDGKPLKSTAEYGTYSVLGDAATGNSFANTARDLSITARFSDSGETASNYSNRRVVVEIKKGMRLNPTSTIPGLEYVGGAQLWKKNLNNLQEIQKGVILDAKFTIEPDTTKWWPSHGGTIEYTIANGIDSVDINLALSGDQRFLSSAYVTTTTTKTIELTDMVTVKSYRTIHATSAEEEIDSAKISKIKLIGMARAIFSSDARLAIKQGDTKRANYYFTGDGLYTEYQIGQSTIKYDFKNYLIISDVQVSANIETYTPSGKSDFWEIVTKDATTNTLVVYIKAAAGTNSVVGFAVTPKADAPVGPADMTVSELANLTYPYDAAGKIGNMRTVKIDVVGPTKEKLTPANHTIGLTKNDNMSRDMPLGGFTVKNTNADPINDQFIKMTFDDDKIDVKKVKIAKSYGSFKTVTMTLKDGSVETKQNVTTEYHGIKDFFPSAPDNAAIREVKFQTSINAGLAWGGEPPYYAAYGNLAYYGQLKGAWGTGDTFTAKISTTHSNDPNFAGSVELPVQTATTTTKFVDNKIMRYRNRTDAKTYNINAGDKVSLSADYYHNDSINSLSGGSSYTNTTSYVKGYTLYLREIPGFKYVDGSLKVTAKPSYAELNYTATTYVTANKGYNMTKFDIPNAVVAMYNGTESEGFAISYELQAEKTAPKGSYQLQEYMAVFPTDRTNVYVEETFNSVTAVKDEVDLLDNGLVDQVVLTQRKPTIINLETPVDLLISTGARLDGSSWETYDHTNPDDRTNGRIILNPDGKAEYGFFLNNASLVTMPEFTAYIPVPKKGQWAAPGGSTLRPSSVGAYDPNLHIQDQAFTWDTFLKGSASAGTSNAGSKIDIFYSDSYEVDNSNQAAWKSGTLSEAEQKSVRTVIVKSKAPILPNDNIEVIFQLTFDDNQAAVDGDAGKINTYSALLSSNTPGLVSGTKNSKPTSIVLRTGVIAGVAWKDDNGNGTYDSGKELMLQGMTVRAYDTGTFDPADPSNFIEEATTTSEGKFRFAGLDKNQDVDVVFFNPSAKTDAHFTVPGQLSQIINDHEMAIRRGLTPSEGAYTGVDAALVYSKTIKFDMNGAPNPTPASVADIKQFPGGLEKVNALTVLSIPNYTFNGWYTAATGGTKITVAAPTDIFAVMANIVAGGGTDTLYAQYARKTDTITVKHYKFVNDGDDTVANATQVGADDTFANQNHGDTFTVTEKTITGYSFHRADPSKTITVSGPQTINVFYKADGKTVNIEHHKYTTTIGDGSKVSDTTQTGRVDSEIVINKATIAGYAYNQAAPILPADMKYNVVSGANTIKLYYKANSYTVSFDGDNGTPAATAQVPFESKVTKPSNTSKTGYTPTGNWLDTGNSNAVWNFTTDTMPMGALNLKAEYTKNNYMVTFDEDGGTALAAGTSKNYPFDSLLTEPATTRPGYQLKGWFLADGGGNITTTQWTFASDKTPASAIKLIAKWEVVATQKVNYTFNLQDGYFGGTINNHQVQTKNAGSTLTDISTSVTKPGMQPMGWYTAPNGGGTKWNFSNKLEHGLFADTTLYAHWAVDGTAKMEVSYNLNGGQYAGGGTITPDEYIVGNAPTQPAGAMTKTGYTFDAWHIEGTGGTIGAKYTFGVPVTSANFGDVKLIAKWNVIQYPVTFDADNGTANTTKNIDFDAKITEPAEPVKEGYSFGGWYNGGTKWTFGTDKMPATAITLKVKWNINSYTLTVDADNGSAPAAHTVVFDTLAPATAQPIKVGYDFVDWYLMDASGNPVRVWNFGTDKMPAKNSTVKAKWDIKTYTININHKTYVDNVATAALSTTRTFAVKHFDNFVPQTVDINYHTFMPAESETASFVVDSNKELNFFYKADKYTMSLGVMQLDLDVNDKYPTPVVNKPSWDEIAAMLDVETVSSNDATAVKAVKSFARAAGNASPVLTSSDYASVDFDTITTGYDRSFTVNATWANGDTDTAAVSLKISDNKDPEILNLVEDRRVRFTINEGDKISEASFNQTVLTDSDIKIIDNYDGVIPAVLEYPSGGYESIDWTQAGEYAFYVTATDKQGNTAKKGVVAYVEVIMDSGNNDGGSSGGTGGGNKPDPGNNLPGDGSSNNNNGSGAGSNGSGNAGGNGSSGNNSNDNGKGNNTVIDGGNLPNGSHIDGKGNLVDIEGNIIVPASKLPNGAIINENGDLVDSKGELIILPGNVNGKTPNTGSETNKTLMILIPVLIAVAGVAAKIGLKKRKTTK